MAEAQTKTDAGSIQAQRIIRWQWCIVAGCAVVLPLATLALGLGDSAMGPVPQESAERSRWLIAGLSMLMGGMAVIGPNWLYVRLAGEEHSPQRLLLLAAAKVLATLVLLALAIGLASRWQWLPAWTLAGVVVAYMSHAWAAYRGS